MNLSNILKDDEVRNQFLHELECLLIVCSDKGEIIEANEMAIYSAVLDVLIFSPCY